MTFYEELQLSSVESKKIIKASVDKREKWRHIFIYNFKVYLVVAFCFFFVAGFTMAVGPKNSIVAVITLLSLLVVRQTDLGTSARGGFSSLMLIFAIYAFAPRLANASAPAAALLINGLSIFAIMVLSCFKAYMANHLTFVLCYLLLLGYDVNGQDYIKRLWGLLFGMILCGLVYYLKNRKTESDMKFFDLFRRFDISSKQEQWYIKFSVAVALSMFIGTCLGINRVMWIGIACMSTFMMETSSVKERGRKRGAFNIVGGILFAVLYFLLPREAFAYIGVLGGICVGYSATYRWQTVFNTLGAIYIAMGSFGFINAVLLRIFTNIFGSVYTVVFDKASTFIQMKLYKIKKSFENALPDEG